MILAPSEVVTTSTASKGKPRRSTRDQRATQSASPETERTIRASVIRSGNIARDG